MGDRYEETGRGVADAIAAYSRSIFGGNNVLFSASKASELIAAALREQDRWYAIEDPEHPAPRDGTELIGLGSDTNIFRIWHGRTPCGAPAWVSYGGAFAGGYITHYRPLPAPPPDTGRDTG